MPFSIFGTSVQMGLHNSSDNASAVFGRALISLSIGIALLWYGLKRSVDKTDQQGNVLSSRNRNPTLGKSHLPEAAKAGDIEEMRRLLSCGANVDEKNSEGYTSLMMACATGQLDAIRILLDHGANVDLKNNDNATGLMIVSGLGIKEMRKAAVKPSNILFSGSPISERDQRIINAVSDSYPPIFDLLVAKTSDLEAKDRHSQYTALRYAVEEGQIGMVRKLIEKGSEVNTLDAYRKTPLMAAAERGRTEIAVILIRGGATVAIADKFGNTPLSLAKKKGHLEVVRVLSSPDECAKYESSLISGQTQAEATAIEDHGARPKRHCPSCDGIVSLTTQSCPSCNAPLFSGNGSSGAAGIHSYLWGGFIGAIALGIVKIAEIVFGFSNHKLEMAAFAIVFISTSKAKKAALLAPKDLAVWKTSTPADEGKKEHP